MFPKTNSQLFERCETHSSNNRASSYHHYPQTNFNPVSSNNFQPVGMYDKCWRKHPMQLPNLREILHENYQGFASNNQFVQLSNSNQNNTHTNTTDNRNMNSSEHMWQHTNEEHFQNTTNHGIYHPVSSTHSSHTSSFGYGNGIHSYNSIGKHSNNHYHYSPTSPMSSTSPPTSFIQHSYAFSSTHPNQIRNSLDTNQHVDSQDLIQKLKERISELEREIDTQTQTINGLQQENHSLKMSNSNSNVNLKNTNLTQTAKFINNQAKKKQQTKKRKGSPNLNEQLSNSTITTKRTLSLIDESSGSKLNVEEELVSGGIEEFSVKWKGELYVLVDVFKNRTQIMNYYVPLYQSQFPDRNCKVVLSSEEYKQLFRENSHRSQSERKHAWRISIFTIDFYNFVKNQQV